MGVEHQNVISFDPATVLPTLVENAGAGITAAMVAARDAAIQTIQDANEIKRKRKEAYLAEVANNLFVGICLLYTSPSPRDGLLSRMPSSA